MFANQAWDAAHRFFALPEATKRQVGFPEPGSPYGWSPFGFESLSASLDDAGARNVGASDAGARNADAHDARTNRTWDLKESYSVGPDCLGPAPSPVDAARRGSAQPACGHPRRPICASPSQPTSGPSPTSPPDFSRSWPWPSTSRSTISPA